MENINLLPETLKVKGSVIGLNKKLKKLTIILFACLLLVALVSTGIFYYFSRELNKSTTNQGELKLQIEALEDTEQKLVLVKDRLQKVGDVYAIDTSYEEVEVFGELLEKLPLGVSVSDANLLSSSIVLNIRAESTSLLEEAFEILVSSQLFKHVEISSINYNPEGGFVISLLLTRKT